MKKEKILITGAAGFIGSKIAKKFEEYRNINMGVIIRRPRSILSMRIDTSAQESKLGYTNAIHNFVTYLCTVTKLL